MSSASGFSTSNRSAASSPVIGIAGASDITPPG
jgi:hypothetical protein